MSAEELKRLSLALGGAETLTAIKYVHDGTRALVREATETQDFTLLDEAIAVMHAAERKGGNALLTATARVPGIEATRWEERARMTPTELDQSLRRSQRWWRSRAMSSVPEATARRRAPESAVQARMVLSPWRVDDRGFPTRFLVGVCARRFKQMIAAGLPPAKVEAQLIAAMLRAQEIRLEKICD